MSAGDDSDLERGGDDTLAAEYVLGVLPPQERLEAASRIESDPVFAGLVDAWEMRLAPLAEAYEEVEPPQAAKRRLDEMLFAARGTAGTRTERPGLWNSLGFWRGLAAAAVVALLAVAALAYLVPPPAERSARLVASLAHDDTDVHYFVIYDAGTGEVALSHVTGARAEGHDFELWVLEGEGAPASLGVIPVGANVQLELDPDTSPPIGTNAVFAISLEPAGGSPTGQPTGPVVAAGDLKSI